MYFASSVKSIYNFYYCYDQWVYEGQQAALITSSLKRTWRTLLLADVVLLALDEGITRQEHRDYKPEGA